MKKEQVIQQIHSLGVLAVIRGPSPELTVESVAALIAGGVTGIEVTFTTPDALGVVRSLAKEYGTEITLGMGTLTAPDQAGAAAEAGARFLVSPHTEEQLAQAMVETGLPVMMGALTPSEVVRARALGSDVVKVFPGSLVGPGYLKALQGPFPDLRLMPTGGVSLDNLEEWFAAGAFAVGVGGSLCPGKLIRDGNFAAITEIARNFTAEVKKARGS